MLEEIQEYYGHTLRTSRDLRTGACCSTEALPPWLRALVEQVHPEVRERFYGCGSPIPLALEGRTVLDLGCGSGRDSYVLSRLVGPRGRVFGVDATEEQLAVARRHQAWHAERLGLPASTVSFLEGRIEDLAALGFKDGSVDVVISNCVVNLSRDKERVFSEIFRVLRPGGELLFSDVFAGRRVPVALHDDPVLVGECLAGALYLEDFRRLMERVGFLDHRVLSRRPVSLDDSEIEARIGMVDFHSLTVRAFRLEGLEDRCEDYGQVAWYRGTIPESPHAFTLDDHHQFRTGMPVPVCGNTAAMLGMSRYADHFRIAGDRSVHYGLFPCGPALGRDASPAGACC